MITIPEVFWFPAALVAGWLLAGLWLLARRIANLWTAISS
jgi:hypothetical protein